MKMRILGTGSSLPKNLVTNDDLAKIMDTSDEWIRERTGIRSRHISTGETVVDLATDACLKALENAGKKPEDVELILVATVSPEVSIPSAACQVQAKLNADNAAAFDINAACSGFIFALTTANAYIQSGMFKNALVVGAEVLSKIMDWNDRGTCILFGDGAGAVYVEADENAENDFCSVIHSNGKKGVVLHCPTRDIKNPWYEQEETVKFVSMDGREVFKFAVSQVPLCLEEVLEKANITKDDVDMFVLHQANLRIISSISKRYERGMEFFPCNMDRVGNMSSASIPVLLDECHRNGTVKKGMKIAMAGFGAGLTYGAAVFTF
ncbi:MAG: ketoacyl-ACP synthase III [Lachnospiraceae bacterium]|nr:ketoacyl-ACP synthase III [Lachnospiraceae bacterium]